MAILVDEDKLRKMLDKFADDSYGVLEGLWRGQTINGLIDKFIEECKT